MDNSNYLLRNSILVTNGMRVFYPNKTFGNLKIDDPEELERQWSLNNQTVAFVYKGMTFVTPFTLKIIYLLYYEGFVEGHFFVPFSHGEIPSTASVRWNMLRISAEASYVKEFHDNCEIFSDRNGIEEISADILSKCFEMPDKGMVVIDNLGKEYTMYPLITKFDSTIRGRIGTYNHNNGVIAFISNTGKSYISQYTPEVISELHNKGYKRGSLYVPFSCNNEPKDPLLLDALLKALGKKK